jgi:hypothetical protein
MSDDQIYVDCDFPGGNIVLDSIEGDTIFVHQDLRDSDIDWFYWYFRMLGVAGRTINVRFTGSAAIGTRGPAASLDGGQTWAWLGAGCVEGQAFRCSVPPGIEEIRFSFGMPYQQKGYERFIRQHNSQAIKPDLLCISPKGRPVEMLHGGRLDGQADYHVWISCRHHCCEMMASYSLEGVIEKLLDDTLAGKWLRDHVAFFITPFMDKDGVEDGDQGKNRRPHDHNRDYNGVSIYPEVASVRNRLPPWCSDQLDMALDLHCPYIGGFLNEFIYFVGGPEKRLWDETNRFSRILSENCRGPIPFYQENNLPFGIDWNTGSEPGRKSSSEWAREVFPGIRVANCIEIPYANALGVEVNPQTARFFGRDLANAISLYLQAK